MTDLGTPHIQPHGVPIAPTVLLPGDPLRAQWIAETFLDDPVCCNRVRNMLGFTGTWRGRPVTVMGTGMGIPSISIYSHELVHVFGATTLVRVGTCGALQPHIDLQDLILAQGASTDSNVLHQYGLPGTFAALAAYRLLSAAARTADERGHRAHVGNVLSSDIFYNVDPTETDRWQRMGVLGVEMESAGLYAIAAAAGVEALGLFTVSDSLVTHASLPPEERERGLRAMVEVALELV